MLMTSNDVAKRLPVGASPADINIYLEKILQLQKSAFHLAYRILMRRHSAEDVVSESHAKAVLQLKIGKTPNDLKRWYFSIVVNTAKNLRRSEMRRKKREGKLAVEQQAGIRKSRECIELQRALEALPDQERLPIVMHYELEMQQIDIAKALNLSRRIVGYRIKKGLIALRTRLKKNGFIQTRSSESMPKPYFEYSGIIGKGAVCK